MKPLTKEVGIDNFSPAYTTKDQIITVLVGRTMILSHYFVNLYLDPTATGQLSPLGLA